MMIDVSITGVDTFRIRLDEAEAEAKRSSRVKRSVRRKKGR